MKTIKSIAIAALTMFSTIAVAQNDTIQINTAKGGSEGDALYNVVSNFQFDGNGVLSILGNTIDWTVTGDLDLAETFNKSFNIRIDAMGTTNTTAGDNYGALLTPAGIDRDNSGYIGVRGTTNGIDPNEGIQVGLDLTTFDLSVVFQLTKVRVRSVSGSEVGIIVNRNNTLQTKTFGATGTGAQIELSEGAIDVSTLEIILKGGETDNDLFSVFYNGTENGNFRLVGFDFKVSIFNTTSIDSDIEIYPKALWQVFPNPAASDHIKVLYLGNKNKIIGLKVYDMRGQCVINEANKYISGRSAKELNISHLTPGVYIICIADTDIVSKHFIKK